MTYIYALAAIFVFIVVVGVVGYSLADHFDKKYGTDL